MSEPKTPSTARAANGRFGPGNPGRRYGSRNHTSNRVILAILNHFEERHEVILDRLSHSFTPNYANLLGRMLPKPPPLRVTTMDDITDEEAEIMKAGVEAALRDDNDPRAMMIEIEAILDGHLRPGAPQQRRSTVR